MLTITSYDLGMSRMAAEAIRVYQHYISPHKGFSCAHRKLHGRKSCSEFARRAVLKKGLIKMLTMLRQRFAACGKAAKMLKSKRSKYRHKSRQTDWKREGVECAVEVCTHVPVTGCELDSCADRIDLPCSCDV